MTIKWQDEQYAWECGARIEQRWRGGGEWGEGPRGLTPPWDHPKFEFRVYDPYREFREAEKRGTLEIRTPFGWDRPSWKVTFSGPVEDYRVVAPAPEPIDPYREFREAEKRGEVVEIKSRSRGWAKSFGPLNFDSPVESYRIAKPEEMKMYWSPAHPIRAPFPTPLGKVLLAGIIERQLGPADVPFLESLENAGVAGAFDLIAMIERHGEIIISEGI